MCNLPIGGSKALFHHLGCIQAGFGFKSTDILSLKPATDYLKNFFRWKLNLFTQHGCYLHIGLPPSCKESKVLIGAVKKVFRSVIIYKTASEYHSIANAVMTRQVCIMRTADNPFLPSAHFFKRNSGIHKP